MTPRILLIFNALLAVLTVSWGEAAGAEGGNLAASKGAGDDSRVTLATSAGLRATVFGPPPAALAELPRRAPLQEIQLLVDGARPVPELYWFNRRLRVGFSPQRSPAPLVVVIAGTGGHANTQKQQLLRRALHGAGYHVLTLPSPTHPGFITAASSSGVAGDLRQDSLDLYWVLRQLIAQLPQRVEITAMHTLGYSLGGSHAAMLKVLDAESAAPLGIERAVMINPPVSLLDSVYRLDYLFTRSIGEESEAIDAFFQRLYSDLSALYRQAEALELDEAFLLGAAGRLLQTDQEFTAAISLSFRLALMDMFFAADYITGAGVVVDPDLPPQVGDPLDEALRQLRGRPFRDYFELIFAPHYLAQRPGWNRADLAAANSLRSIEEVLAAGSGYFVQHTVDDPILDADELAWLVETLGPRIAVYPRGGHLGNVGERRQIEDMLSMLAGHWCDAGAKP